MKHRAPHIFVMFGLAFVGLLILPRISHAQDGPESKTVLIVAQVSGNREAGQRLPLLARLSLATGAPVHRARIEFLVDGQRDGEAWTDAAGNAHWRLRSVLGAGRHTIEAVFAGQPGLSPARNTTDLDVQSAVLEVRINATRPRVGEPIKIDALLRRANLEPARNARITFLVDGRRDGEAWTDTSGSARWTVDEHLNAGVHIVQAVFEGRAELLPASTITRVPIQPALLEIETVPPLAGVHFTLNGKTLVSDAHGIARTEVAESGTHDLAMLQYDPTDPHVRAEFTSWSDTTIDRRRPIHVASTTRLQAGFNVSYLAKPVLVDLEGRSVDPSQFQSFVIQIISSRGTRLSLDNLEPRWLQGTRAVQVGDRLEPRAILYSVEDVVADGSSLVNRSQQRYVPGATGEWRIRLMLYTLRFRARDALYGVPLGSGVILEYPDGHSKYLPFGDNAQLQTAPLVRGAYRVRVVGAYGIAPTTPIALSRDQEVRLVIISYVDLVALALVMVAVAQAFLLAGRPELVLGLRRLLLGRQRASARHGRRPAHAADTVAEPHGSWGKRLKMTLVLTLVGIVGAILVQVGQPVLPHAGYGQWLLPWSLITMLNMILGAIAYRMLTSRGSTALPQDHAGAKRLSYPGIFAAYLMMTGIAVAMLFPLAESVLPGLPKVQWMFRGVAVVLLNLTLGGLACHCAGLLWRAASLTHEEDRS
jgi:hypothetical protein